MTWAKTHRDLHVVSVTAGVPVTFSSSVIITQRINDERGGVHGTFFPDPVTVTGNIFVMARLHPDAQFAKVFEGGSAVELDVSSFHAILLTATNNSIPILPQMRIDAVALDVGTSSVASFSLVE